MFRKLTIAVLALSAIVPAAEAYDFKAGGVYYNISQDGRRATVTYSSLEANDYTGNVVIPATVIYNGAELKVREIGDFAFVNCPGIKSVSISESVVMIGQQAFSHCTGITSLTLPPNLNSLGDYALEYCSGLTSINIPQYVETLGDGVFLLCTKLKAINVAEENTKFRSIDGVLYTADKAVLMCYPGGSEITELTVADEATDILMDAFTPAYNLQKITLGASVRRVQDTTFSVCPALKEFSVADDNQTMKSVDGLLLDKSGKTLLQYPLGLAVESFALPEGIETLVDLSMAGAVIGDLTLPASLTTIGSLAFAGTDGVDKLHVKAVTPPAVEGNSQYFFTANVQAKAPLIVPEGSVDAYKRANGWRAFKAIRDTEEAGIADITTQPAGSIEVYDLHGRRVFSGDAAEARGVLNGIFIVRDANGTRKAAF